MLNLCFISQLLSSEHSIPPGYPPERKNHFHAQIDRQLKGQANQFYLNFGQKRLKVGSNSTY